MKKQKKGKQSTTEEATTEKIEDAESGTTLSAVESEKADYIAKLHEHN